MPIQLIKIPPGRRIEPQQILIHFILTILLIITRFIFIRIWELEQVLDDIPFPSHVVLLMLFCDRLFLQ